MKKGNFCKKINLIKVDVEGFELEFFLGGLETIQKNVFPPIIFELWTEQSWYKNKAHQTKKILLDLGYSFFDFGQEILAQHANHPTQCLIEKNNNNINLTIAK